MSKASDVVAWARARVGNPYIYGGTGQTCTPSYRRTQYNQYPAQKNNIINNCPVLSGSQSTCTGCKWDGKAAYDCAQFVKYAMKQAGVTLASGSNSQWSKTDWAERDVIANMPTDRVTLVFRNDGTETSVDMGHVGIYCGDGYVIHAKGHAYGVVKDLRTSGKWSHYGIPVGLHTQTDNPGSSGGSTEPDPDTPSTDLEQPTQNGVYLHPNGYYYGNVYLQEKYMQANALYIAKVLREKGWTDNAIAALLGNMESESKINPGVWQSLKSGNTSGGYGLTQWTPASKYINWVNDNDLGEIYSMDNQLYRIELEFAPGANTMDQYYSTSEYPVSRTDFPTSTLDPDYLARAFVRNYEKPYSILYGTEAQKQSVYKKRGDDALKWYKYITENEWSGGTGEDEPITITFDLTLWLATRRAKIVVR